MIKILTLNWNGKDKLQRLYPTLLNAFEDLKWEWYIKDNGSKDESLFLEKEWNNSQIHFVKCDHNNDNFAKGCNILYKESSSKEDDFILLLNNDVIFNDNVSVKNMTKIFNDKDVGLVGAKLLYSNTNNIQHAGVIFDRKRASLPCHFMANKSNKEFDSKNREFQATTGAVWLTKSNIYENICRTNKSSYNGLDENFHWCFEDVSAGLSIKYDLNKKVVVCGSTNIFHEESASLKKNPVNRLFLKHNVDYFLNKWQGRYIVDKDSYENNLKFNLYG